VAGEAGEGENQGKEFRHMNNFRNGVKIVETSSSTIPDLKRGIPWIF
jgi:hypothetical protein